MHLITNLLKFLKDTQLCTCGTYVGRHLFSAYWFYSVGMVKPLWLIYSQFTSAFRSTNYMQQDLDCRHFE